MPIFMRRFKKVRGGGGIYARLCLLFGNDINSILNEIGKEILLMEITKTKRKMADKLNQDYKRMEN